MAERLRSFDFTAQSAITAAESKGRNRYPWTDWFDGDIWKISQGTDFETSPLMMERIIRTRASNKNHKAKVTLRHIPALNGDSAAIVLQRTDIPGPSARKRSEAKERRQAKREAADQAAQATLQAAGITPVVQKANGVKQVSKRPAKKPPAPRRKADASA